MAADHVTEFSVVRCKVLSLGVIRCPLKPMNFIYYCLVRVLVMFIAL